MDKIFFGSIFEDCIIGDFSVEFFFCGIKGERVRVGYKYW